MIALRVILCGVVMAVRALDGVVVIVVFAHQESPVRWTWRDVTMWQFQSQTRRRGFPIILPLGTESLVASHARID